MVNISFIAIASLQTIISESTVQFHQLIGNF